MAETRGSPKLAPEYALHREFKAKTGALVDALPVTDQRRGINMGGYRYANVQVLPVGAAAATTDPAVALLWWSEGAGKFVQEHVAIAKAGVGDGKGFEFTVECNGRIMFVAITGGLVDGEEAEVYVSGFDRVQV